MVARARALQANLLPHGWLDALRQVSLFGLAYLGYRLVRGLADGSANAAFAHARDVISLERTLHVFVEPSIQAWVSGSHFVIVLSSWLYVNAQGTITIVALLYLYLRHNSSFYFVRNMFMIAMAIALVGYVVFPTAPPRFMPEWGFTDTVADLTPVNLSHTSASMSALFNPYAAVPSMHVTFALMIGWPLARLAPRRAGRVAWFLYPFVMVFVIVVTANHFIADALFGALTAAISAYGASWLARIRPGAWRFSVLSSRAGAEPFPSGTSYRARARSTPRTSGGFPRPARPAYQGQRETL
jgi:membrane-associated phospholipid phosphatase